MKNCNVFFLIQKKYLQILFSAACYLYSRRKKKKKLNLARSQSTTKAIIDQHHGSNAFLLAGTMCQAHCYEGWCAGGYGPNHNHNETTAPTSDDDE